MHIFHARRQKAARACGRIVNGADDAGLGQGVVVFHKHQRSSEAHNVARGKVLPGGFIRAFGKAADQFFKHQTHVVIGNGLGA